MESERKEFSSSSGAKLVYFVSGNLEGRPLMLMHGWGCNHTTVNMIAQTAIECGYKVINVDFPGFGDSPEPSEVWGVDDYSNQIEEMMSHEGIDSPVLIGHSFGGRVAILIGSRRRCEKIVLVDSAGVKPRRSLMYYARVYSYKFYKRLLPLLMGANRAESFLEKQRQKKGSSDYRNASPKMRAIMSRVVNEDLKHVMPHISCPTLLIWGENDTATPLSDAETMKKLIPDAGLVSFEGCGHYSFLDNPMKFRLVLKNFLTN